MRHKPPWNEIRKLPAFTLPSRGFSFSRKIYFHFYLPEHIMRTVAAFIEVCGTQLQNPFPPRPHHWYVSAFNPKSGLALAYLWHEEVARGEWVTIDMEGVLTLKVGKWHARNDRAWRPKRLSSVICELAGGNKQKREGK
jgi:hypothetical protein